MIVVINKRIRKGGPGSGFYGHAGRPGLVGGSAAAASGAEEDATSGVVDDEGTLHTNDVDAAAQALAEGRKVVLKQPRQLSTLIDKLALIVADATARGEKAPTYNLCNVSVEGTNLFCAEHKGYSRIEMPQLKGVPEPGSLADALPRDDKGRVNVGLAFRDYLASKGVGVEETAERAAYLRASQSELDGALVGRLAAEIRQGIGNPDEPIFISNDNYIIDGHHRWAANVGIDVLDNKLGNVTMPVSKINMDVITVLEEARRFTKRWGMIPEGVSKALLRVAAAVQRVIKGEEAGHPFRGNQYGGGSSSQEAAQTAVQVKAALAGSGVTEGRRGYGGGWTGRTVEATPTVAGAIVRVGDHPAAGVEPGARHGTYVDYAGKGRDARLDEYERALTERGFQVTRAPRGGSTRDVLWVSPRRKK
jgi:hypothetical protein